MPAVEAGLSFSSDFCSVFTMAWPTALWVILTLNQVESSEMKQRPKEGDCTAPRLPLYTSPDL